MCLEYIHFMLMNNANFQCNHGIHMEKHCKLVELYVDNPTSNRMTKRLTDRVTAMDRFATVTHYHFITVHGQF